ncbi:hypothetical protein [Poriferisphaera sp. WC338]|uniref:hypothetical protein n=1 Tax=Poriferisphaera sp. WC338 TaxID=3425129 RepID=UPI003D81B10B
MPKSSSKSSQAQTSLTQGSDQGANVIGSKGAEVNNIGPVQTDGGDVTLEYQDRGLDPGEIVDLVDSITGGVDDVASTVAGRVADANSAVADIARSATGAESETGKLINKYALPALALVALMMFWKRGK